MIDNSLFPEQLFTVPIDIDQVYVVRYDGVSVTLILGDKAIMETFTGIRGHVWALGKVIDTLREIEKTYNEEKLKNE